MSKEEFIRIQVVPRVLLDTTDPRSSSSSKKAPDPTKQIIGELRFEQHHLVFQSPEPTPREIRIWYELIEKVERKMLGKGGTPISIFCKDYRVIRIVIEKEREASAAFESLLYLAYPVKIDALHCFANQPNYATDFDGWKLYSAHKEYARQGLPNDKWVFSDLNRKYEVCNTYPSLWCVPATLSSGQVLGSAKFRSKARLPVLSYIHPANQAVLTRCAQPLPGVKGNRSVDDEALVQAVFFANPTQTTHYIVDLRPRINAMANRAKGAGYEDTEFYPNCKYIYAAIDNIHVMRDSMGKMLDALNARTCASFLSELNSSGWLKHVKSVLDSSWFMARAISREGASIVCHCSDGWDRTSQTVALCELLLDPYFRTFVGYQILIEKEWLAFGHKFNDRCSLTGKPTRDYSPIFTQFLDATWQLQQQYPQAFEFNETFLLDIHDALYTSKFGTFLGNCESFRKHHKLASRTPSFWTHAHVHRREYTNFLYVKHDAGPLVPQTTPQRLHLWLGLYARHVPDLKLPAMSYGDMVAERALGVANLQSERELLSDELCNTHRREIETLDGQIARLRVVASKQPGGGEVKEQAKALMALLQQRFEQVEAKVEELEAAKRLRTWLGKREDPPPGDDAPGSDDEDEGGGGGGGDDGGGGGGGDAAASDSGDGDGDGDAAGDGGRADEESEAELLDSDGADAAET